MVLNATGINKKNVTGTRKRKMAMLAKLKTSKKERSASRETVDQRLQRKLIERLREQKEFAEADIAGEAIIKTVTKFVPNKETGELVRQEVPKRIKRWFWKEADGTVCMKLLYGASVIDFNGENSTFEVKELSKLPETIDMVIEAIEAGELDDALMAAMVDRRSKLRGIK
ncbi:MAG: hypothetical protein ACI9JL_001747 [Paracoccaceae bacterium]